MEEGDLVDIYDSRLAYYSPIATIPLQALSALVNVHDLPGPTLDVGCGIGYSAQWLPEVVGVDYSPARVAKAQRLHPGHEWIFGNVFDWLTETDRRFSSAVCVEVLEHTEDPRRLIKLMRAVVDGPIVATVPLGILDETHVWDWRTTDDVVMELAPQRIAVHDRHAVLAWVHHG
jgi:2-polyprenyl-3-methyl-5-hydroxy-6-metoxy-1,4-benzoquinol methylase